MFFDVKKIGIIADLLNPEAMLFKEESLKKLNFVDLNLNPSLANSVEILLVLGGDGFLLHVVHQFLSFDLKIYGINYGNLGFLLNSQCSVEKIMENISQAKEEKLKLLKAKITTEEKVFYSYAMNEVSLFRESGQVAKIKIYVDGILRMEELASDGVVLSTAAGSTAYNFSLHGPIFSPEANVLSLCPVSPFRPRHWRGALILDNSKVLFEALDVKKRPVLATADFHNFPGVKSLEVSVCNKKSVTLLFDKNTSLKEKILAEQFLI